jgi:tRNA threonylcarbamoyladenosine biosynthesis protein TsaB
MGEVYWAIYDNGSISNMRICKPEDVDNLGASLVGLCSGWKVHNDELIKASKINHTDSNIYPESTNLIDLSLLAIESGQKATFKLPQPIYLRNNVAQKSLK